MKMQVYRKKTHTDQYLHFTSHHPLHHKLRVVRTLMDRCKTVVTEPGDRKEKKEHIVKAVAPCGYPKWTFDKVKQQKEKKRTRNKGQEKERQTERKR